MKTRGNTMWDYIAELDVNLEGCFVLKVFE